MEKFEDLVGETLLKVENLDDEKLVFALDNGEKYQLYHNSDCCESVTIEEIIGDLNDLIGTPITLAEEVIHEQDVHPKGVKIPEYQDSFTWTFYKLATIKGSVTIRWYGNSNGYYSESVDWGKISN